MLRSRARAVEFGGLQKKKNNLKFHSFPAIPPQCNTGRHPTMCPGWGGALFCAKYWMRIGHEGPGVALRNRTRVSILHVSVESSLSLAGTLGKKVQLDGRASKLD